VEIDGTDDWEAGAGATPAELPIAIPSAGAWNAAVAAVHALDASASSTTELISEKGAAQFTEPTPTLQLTAVPKVQVDGDAYATAVSHFTAPDHLIAQLTLTYDDGCGGTLTTTLRAVGTLFVPPPVCVPTLTDRPSDIQLDDPNSWVVNANNTVSLTLSTSDAAALNALVALLPADAQITAGHISVNTNAHQGTAVAFPAYASGVLTISKPAWDTANAGDTTLGTATEVWTYSYGDGCGTTYTTTFTVTGVHPVPVG